MVVHLLIKMPNQIPQGGSSITAKDGTPLNPLAVNLAKSIRQVESGGDYNAVGDLDKGVSRGAYQFNKNNFQAWAVEHDLDPNDFSPTNQDKVAYARINSLLQQGKAPSEVAAIWNGAKKVGNKFEAINPAYVDKVKQAYGGVVGGTQPIQSQSAGGSYPPPPQSVPFVPNSADSNQTGASDMYQPEKSLAQKGAEFLFPILEQKERTPMQWAGDIGLSALTLVPGLGEIGLAAKGTKLAAGLAKGAEAVKATDAALGTKGLLAPALKGAGLGYGVDVASNLSEGETNAGSILTPGLGTATGGVLGTTGGVIGNKIATAAERTPVSRLTEQTDRLKTLKKAFNENSTKTTNPIKTLEENKLLKDLRVENGRVNTAELTNLNRTGSVDNLIEQHADDADTLIETLEGSAKLKEFQNKVLAAVRSNAEIRDAGQIPKAEAEVKRIFASYKGSFGNEIPWKIVNSIRKRMNRIYDPDTVDVARTIGNVARDYLYNGSGVNTAIKTAMQNEAELIKTLNFIKRLDGTVVKGGQLGKYFNEIPGSIAGGAIGSIGGPVGSAGGVIAGKYITDLLTDSAQKRFFNPLSGSVSRGIKNVTDTNISKMLKGVLDVGAIRSLTGK